jgi:hypothetical protein
LGKITKSIASKLIWAALGFIVLYLAAATFNLVPQSMKDTVNWFGSNFELIVFLLCFSMGFLILWRMTGPKKSKGTYGRHVEMTAIFNSKYPVLGAQK